jgi:hypothetical protein
MIPILLQLVVEDLRSRGIRFEGFRVVDRVIDYAVDFRAGGTGASGCF